ncbi:hypothetical protein CEK29_08420 [Bordetella genomosp. 5]|uniref:putative phage abortive infection protein n=1 Tax=Bordetella genomosp. 5 TaxID=1395608 RepID=UPI000B9EA46D|nr:putative phage abortive infection protein [Bordetella genomosp. 5]OZI44718.1 hypothetical protein CEK29_08420 [Bordetella genomosp. 5]
MDQKLRQNALGENWEEERLQRSTTITVVAVLVVLLTVPAAYFAWWHGIAELPINVTDPAAWGAFGDFFGGLLNPVVAFLALFWLTRSIQIQRTELRETRRAMSEQSATLDKQRFEDTFFALLDQHNKVLDSLSARSVYEDFSSEIERVHHHSLRSASYLSTARQFLMRHDASVGHYFRILYQLFKLIATNSPGSTLGGRFTPDAILDQLPSDEEKKYANIVRAFLSSHLTQLLAVNCYCKSEDRTYWAYKCLVERYSLLEHMPFDVNGEDSFPLLEAREAYKSCAFGNSEFVRRLENSDRWLARPAGNGS